MPTATHTPHRPAPGTIHLWVFDISPQAGLLTALSNADLAQAASFIHPQDQQRYARSRAALRWVLADQTGTPALDQPLLVDNMGKLITDSSNDAALGLTAAQTQHKQKMEDVYRQRVMQILAPIVGDNNVRSQVNMALDFTQTEVTTEDFDTREKGPKTRSEAISEDKNSAMEAAGVPGTLSNTPPPAPSATTNSSAATSAASSHTADVVGDGKTYLPAGLLTAAAFTPRSSRYDNSAYVIEPLLSRT